MPNFKNKVPRDRLLETARELFLRDGVPQTGINTVTAKAEVARMTLYNNFASKNELILAVFEQESERRREAIESTQKILEGPFEKVLAIFVVALDFASQKGFRGCAFINLAIEAAAPDSALHDLAKRHKDWIHQNVLQNLGEGNFTDPEALARQICVLWDGGSVGAYVHQSDAPILTARDAARALMRGAAL